MTDTAEKDQNSVVAIYGQHPEAENAVKELKAGGFDIKKLSIIGRDYHSEDNVVGFYNTGDRMKYWGKQGAFWGGLWGMLFGAAFLFVPGIGPVVAAGSVVTWIISALEGAIVIGGLSALGAALYSFATIFGSNSADTGKLLRRFDNSIEVAPSLNWMKTACRH